MREYTAGIWQVEPGSRRALDAVATDGICWRIYRPVAVTVARANYVLALGKLVSAARRPIQIPVYLADSLFLPREVEKTLIQQLNGIEISFGPKRKKSFVLPTMLVNQPENFDDAIAAAVVLAKSHAEKGRESREYLSTYLHKAVPALSEVLQREEIVSALWEFVVGLSELIRLKQNSIWSFIIRNSYRPAMLRQQFDIILGNPPWVSYRYVTDPDYQTEIKRRAVDEYKIAPRSQKLFTQMELATVFLAHSMHTFARPGARLAFVMPRSVLSSDQHQNLIQRTYSAPFRLTQYWDLWDVEPLFNVPSCVLFAEQSQQHGSASDVLPASIWQGRLSGRDLPWAQVAARLSVAEKEARVIWLGSRSALSTETGASAAGRASPYARSFKQGATIVPKNFYFVSIDGLEGRPDPDRLYACRTDEEGALTSKKPYRDVRLQGNVEGRFLFSTAVARHVLPFALLEPSPVVLPVEEENGRWYTASATSVVAGQLGLQVGIVALDREDRIVDERCDVGPCCLTLQACPARRRRHPEDALGRVLVPVLKQPLLLLARDAIRVQLRLQLLPACLKGVGDVLRKTRPRTTCLYSAVSICPRRASAAFHIESVQAGSLFVAIRHCATTL